MINKRLLVKALLAHNNENSFFDKKLKINLNGKEGKAKFLKHVCALSNSNPNNNSYIVIGVEDQNNEIIGVDFFDDSKIQNLINAYLDPAPLILYENIPFPHLQEGKVVGLVTIRPHYKSTFLQKNIWKYKKGMHFLREGSMSVPDPKTIKPSEGNRDVVSALENRARNNIKLTLDGVMDFMKNHQGELIAQYKVFKEFFVVCWYGVEKQIKGATYYSRVDIELINEQVKLFYSNLDEVEISFSENEFIITEYIELGINGVFKFYPLEEVRIIFEENGNYLIDSKLLFELPNWNIKTLHHLMNSTQVLVDKIERDQPLNLEEQKEQYHICSLLMMCLLFEIPNAKEELERVKKLFKNESAELYQTYKDTQRVLRKIKYN
jgi:hypothetical protein